MSSPGEDTPTFSKIVSGEEYRALGFPGADELANMFQFEVEFEEMYCAARDLVVGHRLHPGLTSYERWLERSAERIPVPMAVG